jgi:hypothetical protein
MYSLDIQVGLVDYTPVTSLHVALPVQDFLHMQPAKVTVVPGPV